VPRILNTEANDHATSERKELERVLAELRLADEPGSKIVQSLVKSTAGARCPRTGRRATQLRSRRQLLLSLCRDLHRVRSVIIGAHLLSQSSSFH
jgi:hypothetical protein